MSNEHYLNNPLIHADRSRALSKSAWQRQFDCTHIRPLIICRGPIRMEAMTVFSEMGIDQYGILLSEKDCIHVMSSQHLKKDLNFKIKLENNRLFIIR